MALAVLLKDPDNEELYGFDWSDFLLADTIAASTWTVPTGLTKAAESADTTTTNVKVAGGTAGARYTIINRITTAAGYEYDRSLLLICAER